MNWPKKLAVYLGVLGALALAGWLFLLAPPSDTSLPDTHPEAVWQRVRALGSYRFTADILQTTVPLPTLTNVGRASKQDKVHLEGETDLPGQTMSLRLWPQGGSVAIPKSSVEVKVEGQRTLARQGQETWQEISNFTNWAAPEGDFLTFLSVARDVTRQGVETRNGIAFTRYSFTLDGYQLATDMRVQLEKQLAETGELPPGVTLDLPRAYRDMVGEGELWVDERGLPLRQILHLEFPEAKDHRQEADITVDFSGFGFASANAGVPPVGAGILRAARQTAPPLAAIALVTSAAAWVIFNQRSRAVRTAISIIFIITLVISPLLQSAQVAAFNERQAQRQREQQSELAQSSEPAPLTASAPSGREALTLIQNDNGSDLDLDGRSDVQELMLGTNVTTPETDGPSAPLVEDGSDTDADGLTDYQETLLGTDPLYADTDDDLITDTLEISGFVYASQTWVTDPLEKDTNKDGLGDGQEWRWADTNWDMDSDGTPDVLDRDNDGDGVPDTLDLSPATQLAQTFTYTNPFELIVNNLSSYLGVYRPTYIEFQLRPTNLAHLRYAFNVLDWPSGDEDGQMRDSDGLTFYDVCRQTALGAGQNPDAQCALSPDDNGDVRLVPLLEIELDRFAVSDKYLYEDIKAYNISYRFSADYSKVTLLVPLQLVTDGKSQENVAFSGKLLFWLNGNVNWSKAHQVRLAWVLQALVDDTCLDYDTNGDCTDEQDNVAQPIHTYYDDWQLTGFNLREEHGVDVALVYEDPAVDPDLNSDEVLQSLAAGLDQTFLAGTVFTPTGGTAPQREIRIGNIFSRWDHTAGQESGIAFRRWNLPNILSVEAHTTWAGAVGPRYYHLDEALANIVTTNTVNLLDSKFTSAWSANAPITPTILIAREDHFRTANLDDTAALAWRGRELTLDLGFGGGNPVSTMASLKWTPYAYDGQDWQAMPMEGYWTELEKRHLPDIVATNTDTPEAVDGKMLLAQMAYLSLYAGIESMVQQGALIISQDWGKDTYGLAGDFGAAANLGLAGLTDNWDDLFPDGLLVALSNLRNLRANTSASGVTASLDESTLARLLKAPEVRMWIFLAVVTLIVAALVVVNALAPQIFENERDALIFQVTTTVVLGALILAWQIIKPIYQVVQAVRTTYTTGTLISRLSQAARFVQPCTTATKVVAVVGLIIDLGVTWGFFFAQWGSGDIQPGTIAFNHAVVVSIISTVLAVLYFALNFIPVIGTIIVAILAIVDLILSFFDTSLAEIIADIIHAGGPLVETRAEEDFDDTSDQPPKQLVSINNVELESQNASVGVVDGADMRLVVDVTTNAYQPVPDNGNGYGQVSTIWSEASLKKAAFVYMLTTDSGATITEPSISDRTSDWQSLGVWRLVNFTTAGQTSTTAQLRKGTLNDTLTGETFTLQQGRNQPVDAYFLMGYAIPAYECWGYGYYSCSVTPDSDVQSFSGTTDPESLELYFDVFPRTLDEFYALTWDTFPAHRDFDGDGLAASGSPYFGNDPNDLLWDTDGDGLSDRYELELNTLGVDISANVVDTDNDGLSDKQEAVSGDGFIVNESFRLGSNPGSADSDGDGLSDLEEVTGWMFTYATAPAVLTTRVTSDPSQRDSDGDGLNDKIERDLHQSDPVAYPFHPRVANSATAFVGFDYAFGTGVALNGRPVIGLASTAYTTTLSSLLPPALALSGVHTLTVPAQLQITAGALSTPFDIAGGQTQTSTFRLNALPGPSGPVTLTHDIAFQFDEERVGDEWGWGVPEQQDFQAAGSDFPWYAAVSPAPSWAAPYVMVSMEGSDIGVNTQAAPARVRVREVGAGAPGAALAVDDSGFPDKWNDAPSIACANDGKCLVMWGEPNGGQTVQNLYGAIVGPGPTLLTPRFAIRTNDSEAKFGSAVASDGTNFLTAWESNDAIYLRTVSNTGAVGGNVQLSAGGFNDNVSLTWAGSKYLAVWQKRTTSGGNAGVDARFVLSDGTLSGGVLAIVSPSSTSVEYPQVAYSPDVNGALVAYRFGGDSLRARTLNVNTNALGTAFIVGNRGADTALLEPRVAFEPVNHYWLVGWLSKDVNNTTTLRYQALGADTAPRAFQQLLIFTGSAPVGAAGLGLACSGGDCAFTNSLPPWDDAADDRRLFVDNVALSPLAALASPLQSITEDVGVVVDADRPTSLVTNLFNNMFFVPGSTRIIQGRSTDPTSAVQKVEVSLDGVNWDTATGRETWLYALTIPSGEGAHTLYLRATDVTGNVESPLATFAYKVDGTPPTLTSNLAPGALLKAGVDADGRFFITPSGTVTDPILPGGLNGSGVSAVSASLTPNNNYEAYEFSPGNNWLVTYTLASTDDSGTRLTDPTGQYTLTLRASDMSWGNPGAGSNVITLTVPISLDNRAPFVRLTTDLSQTVVITQPLALTGVMTETGPASGVAGMEAAYFPADLGYSPGQWRASYFNNSAFQQPPAVSEVVNDVDFDWGTGAPSPELPADNFSAAWTRDTTFRVSGTYLFTVTQDADGLATIMLDNAIVLTGTGSISQTAHVTAGVHTLRVLYREGAGDARVAFHLELTDSDWQPFTIDQPGAGVVNSSWTYTVPESLEGFYRLGMRGVDQFGNRDPQTFNWEVWRGEIDTAAPRAALGIYFTGFGNTAQTHYVASVEDFNLTETGLVLPCDANTVQRYYYPTSWWRDWFADGTRLFQITATCSLPGFQTDPPTLQACDLYGHCSAINPTVPDNPNYRTIYWSDLNGATNSRIRYISLEDIGAGPQTLIANTGLTSTAGLALDPPNDDIYWTDRSAGTLRRANLADGSNNIALISGLAEPTHLTLGSGYLFWTEYASKSLFRADTSGLNVTTLISNTSLIPTGVAVDVNAGKVYWGQGAFVQYNLNRMNLDGTNIENDVAYTCVGMWPGGLAIDSGESRLYWIETGCAPNSGLYRALVPYIPFPQYLFFDPVTVTNGIALDVPGQKMYWTNANAVMRAALDGAFTETVVSGLTNPASLALNFNYAPLAPTATVLVFVNTPTLLTLPANDPDGDSLTFNSLGAPNNGVLGGLAPNLVYTPSLNFQGEDVFTYTVSDGQGGLTNGQVNLIVQPGALLDSIIITPTEGAVVTIGSSVVVTGATYAQSYLKALTFTVDGATEYTQTWPPTTLTETTWAAVWDPFDYGEGEQELIVTVADHAGQVQTNTHPVQIWFDANSPGVTIAPTVLTTTYALPQLNSVALGGAATDLAGVASVQVSIDGGVLDEAEVLTGTWTYPWSVSGNNDGGLHTVSALAADRAGRTAQVTNTVTVDIAPPTPVTVTLAYTNSIGARVPISVGQAISDTPITLIIEWTASSDGAGLAEYRVGWTTSPTPTLAALTAYAPAANRHHPQGPAEAQILYAHVFVRDVNGNLTTQTLGSLVVDSRFTPDLIDDLNSRSWMATGGSQIGTDREFSRTLSGAVQTLHLSWDADTLRFTWAGANWENEGNLFIYLDITPTVGATTAFNSYSGAQPTIGLADLNADYALWVEDPNTASLLLWNGSAWVTQTVLTSANFQLDTGIRPAHTDLLIPFAWLGITTPATASLKAVAFATEEDALNLWAAMPDHNPLNSLRAADPVTATTGFALTRRYVWSSLGLGLIPNAGQFADIDLRVTLTPDPTGLAVGFLEHDLLDVLPPGTRLDANLDGEPDVTLPFDNRLLPLGNGQTVTYTVYYENRGAATANGVVITATAYGALTLSGSPVIALPNVGPGVTGTLTFTGTIIGTDASAEVDAVIADTQHGPFEWWTLQHDVDNLPPTGLTISAPITTILPLTNTVFGAALDPSGVPTITLEITLQPGNIVSTLDCTDEDPFDGQWACDWSTGIAGVTQAVLRAKATDGVGNISLSWSAPVTLTVDNTPPTLILSAESETLFTQGLINVATASGLILTGTVSDDFVAAAVDICDTNNDCGQIPVLPGNAPSGAWTYPVLFLPDGDNITNTVVLYGVDGAGNRSQPLMRTYAVDTIAPVLQVSQVRTSISLSSAPTVVLTGTVSDGSGVSEVYVRVEAPSGQVYWTVAESDGVNWQFAPEVTETGAYTIWIEAWDAAGNVSNAGPYSFIVTSLIYLPVIRR